MVSEKKQRLDRAIASIRHKWGETVLHQLDDSHKSSGIPHVPTGFPRLDAALGIGGVPRGHLTHLLGAPTSGATTLACKLLAHATGEAIVYVDLTRTFDAD